MASRTPAKSKKVATTKAKAPARKKPAATRPAAESASKLIDERIRELGDWRGRTLQKVRKIIKQADPGIVEDVKWKKPSNSMRGVPVWSLGGMICTGEIYKDKVKLTFAKGAALKDASRLFNASLDGNARRAIDIRENDLINETALTDLVRAAIALNHKSRRATANKALARGEPKLLSGGNPQIAKGDGDAPVQAYITAMPGWKRDVGRQLDALIERTVPGVHKAVKWNSPFYGVEDQGWFLSFHCFARYIKVAFFRGTSLRPAPPVESKHKDVRYFHVHEDDSFDAERLATWIKQASRLPGEKL